jgi:hypothetical protein
MTNILNRWAKLLIRGQVGINIPHERITFGERVRAEAKLKMLASGGKKILN